jgi:hypothetical protein
MHILALDADDVVKLVFAVVFGLIWAISGIVSWLSKQHQAEQRRQAQEAIDRANRGLSMRSPAVRPAPPRRISPGLAVRHPEVLMPPAPPPLPVQRRPAPPPPLIPQAPPRRAKGGMGSRRQQPQQSQRRQPQAQRSARTPPPLFASPETAGSSAPRAATAPIEATAITDGRGPARRTGGGPTAAALHQWLTPQTLRSQYILTEILQPPLALRPDRLDA